MATIFCDKPSGDGLLTALLRKTLPPAPPSHSTVFEPKSHGSRSPCRHHRFDPTTRRMGFSARRLPRARPPPRLPRTRASTLTSLPRESTSIPPPPPTHPTPSRASRASSCLGRPPTTTSVRARSTSAVPRVSSTPPTFASVCAAGNSPEAASSCRAMSWNCLPSPPRPQPPGAGGACRSCPGSI